MSLNTIIVIVLALIVGATVLGLLLQRRRGRVVHVVASDALDPNDFGLEAFSPTATVVQFSTTYCQRCPGVRTAITELVSGHDDVVFAHVDVTDDTDLAKKHDLWQTPTIFLIDGSGRTTTRLSGPVNKSTIDLALRELV